MEDRAQVTEATKPGATHQLQGEWGKFLACVLSTRRRDGKPTPIARLSHKTGHVPGFGPGQDVQMKVLAPIEHTIDGKPAIRRLAPADSKNTNGNSILLRLDYGNVRILLTGDLNTLSQHALEQHYQDELKREFACDVAKACHHGSDDVSYRFLEAMNPAVTVISSGDSEGHDHPRPAIVAASATAGYRQTDTRSDRLISPLIYSTELARSLNVGRPTKLKAIAADGTAIELDEKQLAKVEVECEQVISGALGATKRIKRLDSNARLVTKSIYGLVNVRTDGKKILCATLNETDDQTWQVKTLTSRF